MCTLVWLSVHASASHRPVMGDEVDLSAEGALLSAATPPPNQGKAGTTLKAIGHTGHTTPSPTSSCPFSLTLTPDQRQPPIPPKAGVQSSK